MKVVWLQSLDSRHKLLIKLSETRKRCIFFEFLNHVKILLYVSHTYGRIYIYKVAMESWPEC